MCRYEKRVFFGNSTATVTTISAARVDAMLERRRVAVAQARCGSHDGGSAVDIT